MGNFSTMEIVFIHAFTIAVGQYDCPLVISLESSSALSVNDSLCWFTSPTPSTPSSVNCESGCMPSLSIFVSKSSHASAARRHSKSLCFKSSIAVSQFEHFGSLISPKRKSLEFVYTSLWAILIIAHLCLVLVSFLILLVQLKTSPGVSSKPDR